MRRATWLWIVALLGLLAGPALAGSTLTIRLVEASNKGGGVSAELRDVADLLQNNLPFKAFQLLATKSVRLPASGDIDLGRGFTAHCEGPQRNLAVRVIRDRKPVLDSTVELQDGTPLILGGFPADGGKMIVILLVR